jgi:hypothetical protein
MTVPRILGFVVVPLGLALMPLLILARQQEPADKKAEETFFAGTVVELTAGRITVLKDALGAKEKREFKLTPDTKCEGKLKTKVRVTVRYVTTDDGEVAELIIVRPAQKKKQ